MGGRLDDERTSLELQENQENQEEEKEGEVMTTRGRRPKSMSPAAIAKREKYAAAKAAKLATQDAPSLYASPDAPDAPITPDELQVEITPNEAPKLSLKDRLFGGVQQP